MNASSAKITPVEKGGAELGLQLQIARSDAAEHAAITYESIVDSPGFARRLVRGLGGLGLGEILAEEAAGLERARHLTDPVKAARTAAQRERTALLERLAAGEDVPAEELYGWHTRNLAYAEGTAIARLYDQAGAACANSAAASAQGKAAEIFAALVKATDDVVSESVKLTKKIPEHVTTDRDAASVGVLPNWLRLADLIDRFAALHNVYTELRGAGWLPQLRPQPDNSAHPGTPAVFLRYGDPDKLPGAVKPSKPNGLWTAYRRLPAEFMALPPNLRLASAARAGAKPGMHTAGAADAAHVKVVARVQGKHRRFLGIG